MLRPDIKIKSDKRTTVVRHRTLPDYVMAMHEAQADDGRYRASMKASDDFQGHVSNEEFEAMLNDGWREGIEDAEGLDGLASDAQERLTFVRNIGGAFPVVPAFLSGDPCAMLQPRTDLNDNVRGVTLVLDGAYNCNVKGHTVLKYAKQVMKLVAWLEAERIETAVYVTHTVQQRTSGNGTRCMYVTPIREAGQIMQPERIASILHPAFFRRAWFSLLEHECYELKYKDSERGVRGGGYGRSTHATLDEVKQVLPEHHAVILMPQVGSGDPTKAIEEALNLKLRSQI
jgi:hypothetical protein